MKSKGLNVSVAVSVFSLCHHLKRIENDDLVPHAPAGCSAVSKAFSPLKSTTTHDFLRRSEGRG